MSAVGILRLKSGEDVNKPTGQFLERASRIDSVDRDSDHYAINLRPERSSNAL